MNSLFIYKNNNYFFVMLLFALCVFTANSLAANSVCGQDLNSSEFLEKNETANCIKVENQDFCTVGSQDCNAKDVCPLGEKYSCQSGSCQKPAPSSCAPVVEVVKGSTEEAPYCSSDEGVWLDITARGTLWSEWSPYNTKRVVRATLNNKQIYKKDEYYSLSTWSQKHFQYEGKLYGRGEFRYKSASTSYYKLLKRIPGIYTCSSTGTNYKTIASCTNSCDGLMQYEKTRAYENSTWVTKKAKLYTNIERPITYTFNNELQIKGFCKNLSSKTATDISHLCNSWSRGSFLYTLRAANGDIEPKPTNINTSIYVYKVNVTKNDVQKESGYSCPYTIDKYDDIKACQSSCFKKQACSKTYSCPTAGNSCVSYEGRQQCSPNSCIDLDENQPIKTDIANAIAIDDGQRDVNGACTDNILLFAGRNSSCRTAGIKTLWKNCCKETDEVIKDTTNGLSAVDAASAIKGVYDAASAAYAAYQAGKTAADALAAAQNSLIGFDPTTIAISLAVSYILKELSCDQQDAETSVLKSSGYCHYVGEYCDTRWVIGCVQEANTYCCFNSKIGRIIQEQARQQTGKSWGSATTPKCTGLTPEEFQSLDFSDIDLSEYYGDIQAKSLAIVEENIGAGVENYYRQIR